MESFIITELRGLVVTGPASVTKSANRWNFAAPPGVVWNATRVRLFPEQGDALPFHRI